MLERGSGVPLSRKKRETHSSVLHEVTQSLDGSPHNRAGSHPDLGANGYLMINCRISTIGSETISAHIGNYIFL